MINENFKKDLVVMIGFSSLERCHTGEKCINGEIFEICYLIQFHNTCLTSLFSKCLKPSFQRSSLDIIACSTLIEKNWSNIHSRFGGVPN